MEDLDFETANHIGHKIGGVRRLVGITQKNLADKLGVTKQAVSKLEQTEKISDEKLSEVANALGVSAEGLKKFNRESVFYNSTNFYENCGASVQSNITGSVENFNYFTVEQAVKLFEELLKMDKEKFEKVK
jgi:transcriptional regulator with XRE-family HTH domain